MDAIDKAEMLHGDAIVEVWVRPPTFLGYFIFFGTVEFYGDVKKRFFASVRAKHVKEDLAKLPSWLRPHAEEIMPHQRSYKRRCRGECPNVAGG